MSVWPRGHGVEVVCRFVGQLKPKQKGHPHRGQGSRVAPRMSGAVLREAAERGDLRLVQAQITAGVDVNESGTGSWTALHRAVDRGRDDIVSVLLEAGADPTLRTVIGNSTAADLAVRHPSILRELVKAGAEPPAAIGVEPGPLFNTRTYLPRSRSMNTNFPRGVGSPRGGARVPTVLPDRGVAQRLDSVRQERDSRQFEYDMRKLKDGTNSDWKSSDLSVSRLNRTASRGSLLYSKRGFSSSSEYIDNGPSPATLRARDMNGSASQSPPPESPRPSPRREALRTTSQQNSSTHQFFQSQRNLAFEYQPLKGGSSEAARVTRELANSYRTLSSASGTAPDMSPMLKGITTQGAVTSNGVADLTALELHVANVLQHAMAQPDLQAQGSAGAAAKQDAARLLENIAATLLGAASAIRPEGAPPLTVSSARANAYMFKTKEQLDESEKAVSWPIHAYAPLVARSDDNNMCALNRTCVRTELCLGCRFAGGRGADYRTNS